VALSGSTVSPGIFEVLAILGPAETKARLLASSG
jgi:glutamyl-tRNA synthetase